jgi:pimeloyl-ACP methyl ester carboxylesterase
MTSAIWDKVARGLPNTITSNFLSYPHEVTLAAQQVEDIAKWLIDQLRYQPLDIIIGHSMGGLVGLILAAKYSLSLKGLILVESNLRPAEEFYRNLLFPKNRLLLGESLMAMIRKEDPYYNDSLKQTVKHDFDFTPYVSKIECPLFGIYGDRGSKNHPDRIRNLNLDEATVQKIRFRFVTDACHMPMLENPEELTEILLKCLNECE